MIIVRLTTSAMRVRQPALRRRGVLLPRARRSDNDLLPRLFYKYYTWRKSIGSDLLLIGLLTAASVPVFALIRTMVVPGIDVWLFTELVFFQETASRPQDSGDAVVFLSAGLLGIVSFAVVLALVQQNVLQTLEERVLKGGPVFESGHVVVLGWGGSLAEVSMLADLVHRLCLSGSGRTQTIVVLTQRPKDEMERLLHDAIRSEDRAGVQLVVRQGNPLRPDMLELVGIREARPAGFLQSQGIAANGVLLSSPGSAPWPSCCPTSLARHLRRMHRPSGLPSLWTRCAPSRPEARTGG